MKLSKFSTNIDRELEGQWVDIGDGAKVLVARLGNERYVKYLERAYKPYRKMQRTGSVPDDLSRKIFIDSLANCILLGWSGITDDAGVDIPYSVEEAAKSLSLFKDFRELIAEISQESATYRDEEIAEDGELLSKKSLGTSSGATA